MSHRANACRAYCIPVKPLNDLGFVTDIDRNTSFRGSLGISWDMIAHKQCLACNALVSTNAVLIFRFMPLSRSLESCGFICFDPAAFSSVHYIPNVKSWGTNSRLLIASSRYLKLSHSFHWWLGTSSAVRFFYRVLSRLTKLWATANISYISNGRTSVVITFKGVKVKPGQRLLEFSSFSF